MQNNQALDTHLAEQLVELLADPALTALTVNDPQSVWQERNGRRLRLDAGQIDAEFISALLQWAASLDFGKEANLQARLLRLDLFSPWRVNILRINTQSKNAHLLNFVRDASPKSLDELNRTGLLPDLAKVFLQACVQARRSILFISPQLKAAQSLQRALVESINPDLQANLYVCESGPNAQFALLTDSLYLSTTDDYFAIAAQVGRDRICLDKLSADSAANFFSQAPAWPGTCACMPAAYTDSALLQLASWLNAAGFIDASARKMIMASFEMIVEIGRDADGLHRVQRILEIDRQADWPGLREIFVSHLSQDDEAAVPVLGPTGLIPHFWPAFAPLGVKIRAEFFDPRQHGFAPQQSSRQQGSARATMSTPALRSPDPAPETAFSENDVVQNLNPPAFPLRAKRENFAPSRTDEFFASGRSEDLLDEAIQQAEARSQITFAPQTGQEVVSLEADLEAAQAETDSELISDDPGWEVEVLHRQPGALPSGGPPEELPTLPEHLQQGLSPELRQSLGELIPDLAQQDADKKTTAQTSSSNAAQSSTAMPNYQPQPPPMHPQALHLQSQLEAPTLPRRDEEALPSQKHLDVQDGENSDKPVKGL